MENRTTLPPGSSSGRTTGGASLVASGELASSLQVAEIEAHLSAHSPLKESGGKLIGETPVNLNSP